MTEAPEKRQAVCLCMILKNEAHVIRRALASIKPWITHWAIVDTGSTDGTQEIVREFLADLPGELIERDWIGFATARNQALELGRSFGPAYLLTSFDADEVLENPSGAALPELEAEAYAVECQLEGDPRSWWRHALLIRADVPWRYESEVHEYLAAPNVPPAMRLGGVKLRSFLDSARNADGHKAKCERDAETLTRLLENEPESRRYTFYLARSLAGAGRIDEAIAAYERRADFGDGSEEHWFALYQSAALREMQGADWQEVVRAYLRAYNVRPKRVETLWALAALHNDHGEHATAELFARSACALSVPHDVQPIDRSIYEWRVPLELATAVANQGRTEEGLSIVRRVAALAGLPDAERANVARLQRELEAALPAAAE